jgi:hypothetical protein
MIPYANLTGQWKSLNTSLTDSEDLVAVQLDVRRTIETLGKMDVDRAIRTPQSFWNA